jgi:hypothetical protein
VENTDCLKTKRFYIYTHSQTILITTVVCIRYRRRERERDWA